MSAAIYDRNLHLPSLSIKGFRGIADLTIPRLGRVTLITGMNNTGKTSILEGVRLLMEGATPEVIREILQFREENEQGMSNIGQNPSGESFLVSALFHGFPQVSESSLPIIISSCENTRKLHMEVGWVWETFDDDGNSRLVQEERAFVGEHDTIPALVVHTENRRRVYPIDRINRLTSNRRSSARNDPTLTESIFVSSSGAERTEMLGPLWDNISLTEREQYVVEALQIIDPKISAVSMVGERSARTSRTAVVRSESFPRRVPLRSFGDGMNRLFGIVLSLVNVHGGMLLIDEFENGMHFSVQVDAWRTIFRLAQILNVQVLATTHSFDCVAGFRQAAVEQEETDCLLVRIDRLGEKMRVVEYTEEDLQVAISQRIEVR